MPEYQRVDAGLDDLGQPWAIGICGADVLVAVPAAPGLLFSPATRERFARAWVMAEHLAEAAGSMAVTTAAPVRETAEVA